MSAPPEFPSRKAAQSRRFRTFDEDDIVRYAMSEEIPVVGLVRDRSEYKEMREMALIFGATRGLGAARERARVAAAAAAVQDAADAVDPR